MRYSTQKNPQLSSMAVSQNPLRCTLMVASTLLVLLPVRQAKVVMTGSGNVLGSTKTIDGTKVDTYLGIPFAEPPIGDLRFREPQPISPWTDNYDATKLPNTCMQSRDTLFGDFRGSQMWNPNTNVSEDCLYLNLWVPNTVSSLATIVWIYGGSYVSGSSTLAVYDGAYLAVKKSVIVASMNYRVGIHGFLYSGTDEAPGNMGLLDQQLAMAWIYNNIEKFGGDQSKITIMGESAGSGSVSHHLLAPSSWGYFTNAIMLSGTSLCPWAVAEDGNMLKFKQFAALLDCENEDNDEIVKCLRQVDIDTLEAKQWELDNGLIGTFSPVVDGKFMEVLPQDMISNGRVKDGNIILGNTKDEGEFFLLYFFTDIFKPEEIWNPKPVTRDELKTMVMQGTGVQSGIEMDTLLYVYEQSLLPGLQPSYRDMMDDILGDYLFKCAVSSFASKFSNLTPKKGTTHMYSFNYRHSQNPWPSWMGSLHGYEIEMVFGLPFNPSLNYTAEDRAVSQNIMEYFTSFAKTGSPNGVIPTRWPEFNSSQEQHIVFTHDASLNVKDDFRRKECVFWNQLLPDIRQSIENNTTSSASVISALYLGLSCVSILISVCLQKISL